MVVRGGLKGDSEYITRPVRMAFEKQAMQYSLQKGILEKAKENAIAYYNDLLGGLYDQVEVTIEESIKEEVAQINAPVIPLSFTLMKDNFDYEIHKSKDMSPAVATFRKDNSEITVGYTQKWTNSYRDLWKSLNDDSSNKVFLKFIDPVSPIENGVVCEYGKSSEAICYVLKDNNLFYLRHRPENDESAKMTIADVLYASFNTSINEKAPEASNYITFVDLIKNAHGQ